jgi:hypothetical protein
MVAFPRAAKRLCSSISFRRRQIVTDPNSQVAVIGIWYFQLDFFSKLSRRNCVWWQALLVSNSALPL